ncbi:MAG: Mg2 transporter protein CorA family protein [candidate division WWE3 bacterium GW2011_GWA1_41_8]|uniref:Mg2 transporter protein CorA family protein n=2 Tax=Katanobacteria TaxID=422282 RepID=A0A0G0ZL58_UNCKA|nr:MAG: Mg2 transporter protein CorA family protein [candidate division WWE3 bacterium GW2011_GWB1_41_6]KKS22786.1 MAG: Mg2 transporter protein CorA family protein [candidate division WWE3 bacterium GW2011_GWA1_41_8]
MLKLYYKNIRNNELTAIQEFKKGSWIYSENPTPEEIAQLVSVYKLDEGLLLDSLDPYEVPRTELEDGILYIFSRFPYEENSHILTTPLLIAIGEDFLLTISKNQNPLLQHFLDGKTEFTTTQKAKFLLQILIKTNSLYKRHIHQISRKIKELSTRLENIDNHDIIKFVDYEGILNDFLSALIPSELIFERLMQEHMLMLFEEDMELVEDLSLSNRQLIEIAKSNLKNIVNVREAYSTIMTNNLNKTMKTLTSITVILTIPTIVASFFGMNVDLPFDNHPLAYVFILLLTFIVGGIVVYFLIKRKLL